MRAWHSTALLLVIIAPFLAGCTRGVNEFSFDVGGRRLPLTTTRRPAKDMQGRFFRQSRGSQTVFTTGLFTLRRPQAATRLTGDFYLLYAPGRGPLDLHLFEQGASSKKLRQQRETLPDETLLVDERSSRSTPKLLRYLVPVNPGTRIVSFEVTSSSPKARIAIRGAGLTKDYGGVEFGSNEISMRQGVTVTGGPTPSADIKRTIRFADLVKNLGGAQVQVVLTYGYESGSGKVQLIAANRAGRSRRYRVNLHEGIHKLYLYTATCGFTPDSITVSSENRGFTLDSILVHRFPTPRLAANEAGSTVPIPADLGAMLSYPPRWWRQKNYELFSWSLFPSVVVLQFRSYGVQASYMKRIAYFVEKRGYTGKLWTNAQLAHLIGWNAHDYRPKDLARFYSLAAREHFALNPQEEHLKAILLANGLLFAGRTGAYLPGHGAILTFADVGSYALRWLLLTHESFHGIFFTHQSYREAVFALWDHTPALEQSLFRNVFLAYEGYDIADTYLVENEFQAYLMEQPVREADFYFGFTMRRRLRRMRIPDTSPLFRYFMAHAGMFRTSAEQVQKAVEKAAGVQAGESVSLVPE